MFQQVADALRRAVASGVYEPGEAIPSIRAQAVQLRINPNTIKRACDELRREGLLELRPGVGLFVTPEGAAGARARSVRDLGVALRRAVHAAHAAGLTRSEVDAEYARAVENEIRLRKEMMP